MSIFVVITIAVLAFTTNPNIEKSQSIEEAWFEYVGPDYSQEELEKQTNYEMLDYTPACKFGILRCAIYSEIVTVNEVKYPAVDHNNKVVFSDERKFTP